MKLFQKDRFKHELNIVSTVRTATSVTKIISRKYRFHVPKRKTLISFAGEWGGGGGWGETGTLVNLCHLPHRAPTPL